MKQIVILFNTLKYLKPKQIFYQFWYRLKIVFPVKKLYKVSNAQIRLLQWQDGIYNLHTYKGSNFFCFLNISKVFESEIDWNFNSYKKLWNYNLNYFDFLNQASMTKEIGLILIHDYITKYSTVKDGKEPYPTSIRIINWVKFIAKHNINNERINCTLKEDANRLIDNLEFHLLANHLLENGFALLFAAHLFDEQRYYKISSKILKTQIDEQILEDGGHFELSPMYHNLMFYRILDCINLVDLNKNNKTEELVLFLRKAATKMLSWTKQMTFKNGSMPLFNDAANGINPNPNDIINYARNLGIIYNHIPISDSGYRVFKYPNYKLIVDVGQIGASYQPAHAHADTFNFELYIFGKPIIIDTGTSTYNIGPRRNYERSTSAHNTVVVNNQNSSQIWSGFRVGNRANVQIIKDSLNTLEALHDGFKKHSVIHKRKWSVSQNEIYIVDSCSNSEIAKATLHFHPNAKIDIVNNGVLINDEIGITFKNFNSLNLLDFNYSSEFNLSIPSKKIELKFNRKLTTIINLNGN